MTSVYLLALNMESLNRTIHSNKCLILDFIDSKKYKWIFSDTEWTENSV